MERPCRHLEGSCQKDQYYLYVESKKKQTKLIEIESRLVWLPYQWLRYGRIGEMLVKVYKFLVIR